MRLGEVSTFASREAIQPKRAKPIVSLDLSDSRQGANALPALLQGDSVQFGRCPWVRPLSTMAAESPKLRQISPTRGAVKFGGFSGTTRQVTIPNLPADARWTLDVLSKKLNMVPEAVAMEVSALGAEVLEANPKVPSREKPRKSFVLIRNPEAAFSHFDWRTGFPPFEENVPTLASKNLSHSRLFPRSKEKDPSGKEKEAPVTTRVSEDWERWQQIHGPLLPKADMSIHSPRTPIATGLSAVESLKYLKDIHAKMPPEFTFPLNVPQGVYEAHSRFMLLAENVAESMGIYSHVDNNAQRYLDEGLRAVYKLFQAKERHPNTVLAICNDYGEGKRGRQIVLHRKEHIFSGMSMLE
jgi:hypothetical protein